MPLALLACCAFALIFAISHAASAQQSDGDTEQAGGYPEESATDTAALALLLTSRREQLSGELNQLQTTLAIIKQSGRGDTPSAYNISTEVLRLKKEIIGITEREVELLQKQISVTRKNADQRAKGHEAKIALVREEENVARLLALIQQYYTDLQIALLTMPSEEEMKLRSAAQKDADRLARTPFSPQKLRLTAEEGSTALAQITRRLNNTEIPETRRETSLIFSLKTRLYRRLVASENRSFRPVGKNNYVSLIRLQPGHSVLRVKDHTWEFDLPDDIDAADHLLTLYMPNTNTAILHLFSVPALLSLKDAHIPAWLPKEFNLPPKS